MKYESTKNKEHKALLFMGRENKGEKFDMCKRLASFVVSSNRFFTRGKTGKSIKMQVQEVRLFLLQTMQHPLMVDA
ncbi:hypothetical protein CR164_00320 [Prosthecochloris marina]|uniref:Uncharacterized protein n=1 Tax=Prosthecochloris marina TaxID=2017681 RepID=A0A317T8K6_9CHLB|nr:hypothetical protein CR164_00320 [Prosthecochloris marina]